MELQRRYEDITKQGLTLVAISYDAPETLKAFTASRGITFPMISDPGSAIIKRYGLLNETMDPKSKFYGVPHPGTFILDRKGVVVSRFFEQAYQERVTVGSLLAHMGTGLDDGISEGVASGREWRTAPLVGIRFLRGLLHDGRAAGLWA